MMQDVQTLQDFYKTALGAQTRSVLMRQVEKYWPDAVSETVVGLGYALPYLDLYRTRSARVLAGMLPTQGVTFWPSHEKNATFMADSQNLPFADQSIDRLLLVHALEGAPHPKQLMREAWRVLVDGGRILMIAANRRGLWSRNPGTPFGMGEPYAGHQLFQLAEECRFTPSKPTYALYMPPFHQKWLLKTAPTFEALGPQWCKKAGGVVMLEARKQLMAGVLATQAQRRGVTAYGPQYTTNATQESS